MSNEKTEAATGVRPIDPIESDGASRGVRTALTKCINALEELPREAQVRVLTAAAALHGLRIEGGP